MNIMHTFLGIVAKGNDLSNTIEYKDAIEEEVYTKYGTHRGSRGEVISYINDVGVWFFM
jgi:hypothetical protein